jgi:hypothetical protein
MNMRTNAPVGERWTNKPIERHPSVPAFLTARPPAPQSNPSRGSFLRLTTIVCVAAGITGALMVDWPRVAGELASAQRSAAAHITSAVPEAAATDRPVVVKTLAIGAAQTAKVEAPNASDVALAKAQLARELTQPAPASERASKPAVQEASAVVLPRAAESGNTGVAFPDRAPLSEAKSSTRALDASEAQRLIRRAEELLAGGDIAAARLILQRMAEANEARAALLLASTYDPLVLEKLKVYAFAADVAKARGWYEKAREMGAPEASRRLELLAQVGR